MGVVVVGGGSFVLVINFNVCVVRVSDVTLSVSDDVCFMFEEEVGSVAVK